jgi:prolipoprotein diacylglyceryltransferase
MSARDAVSRKLDELVRTRIRVAGRPRPAFLVCGFTGLFAAIVLTAVLVARQGLPLLAVVGIALVGCGTFLGLAMATKIVTGEEKLIYYHHEIAILLNTGVLVWLLGLPVLPYLDATVLGVGAFLACGRVGCLMVGCCHGRPHPFGACYRPEHAEAGFAAHWVGVRLFPIQAVESLWVAGAVAAGAMMIFAGRPAGSAFAWYVVAYDVGRFAFEFARGDSDRPYHLGFSQAQWLSLILTAGVAGAEVSGVLPLVAWHVAAAPALALAMIAVALHRRRDPARRSVLLHAHHLDEMARALTSPPAADGGVPVARTSLGIQLSRGESAGVRHHTLSRAGAPLGEAEARALAAALLRLRGDDSPAELLPAPHGVYHVVRQSRDG